MMSEGACHVVGDGQIDCCCHYGTLVPAQTRLCPQVEVGSSPSSTRTSCARWASYLLSLSSGARYDTVSIL